MTEWHNVGLSMLHVYMYVYVSNFSGIIYLLQNIPSSVVEVDDSEEEQEKEQPQQWRAAQVS